MCGIGGIVRVTPAGRRHEPIPEAWVDALDAAIAWRGRDGAGRFRDLVIRPDGTTIEVVLVHRRLSIIDHEGGAQPMVSERGPRGEGLVAVVFNGCIYNHRELRKELEARGHKFETHHSDTEVLIHAWREWGRIGGFTRWVSEADDERDARSEFADRLDGMFALAIWDADAGELCLLRDGFGEKPLYFRADPGSRTLVFSSVPARTLPAPGDGVARTCPDVLLRVRAEAYLSNGYAEPIHDEGGWVVVDLVRELFTTRELRRHTRTQRAMDLVVLGYMMSVGTVAWIGWIILFGVPLAILNALLMAITSAIPPRPLLDRYEKALAKGVASRLEADVPLGCFLSGGIDSSLIAMYAQRHLGGRLTTLCVRMPDERYDESIHAQRVADHLGTNNITLDCPADSAAEDLVKLIDVMGVPFGDSSILPTYWLCKAAREHVKVALAGDGGDEMFFGYERYRAAQTLGWLGVIAWLPWLAFLDRSDPRSRHDRLARLIVAARHDGYEDLLAIFPTPDFRRLLKRSNSFRIISERSSIRNASQARQFDLMSYLPGDLLPKLDTASMLAGIEVRCPFLSRAVADIAMAPGVGARQLMPRGKRKFILKEIARKHLPVEVVDRPKQGFAIPIGEWWRSDFGGLRTLLMDSLSGDKPFGPVHDVLDFNMNFVQRMIDEHWAAGGLTPVFTTRNVTPRDHSQRLFALVTLAIWAGQAK